MGSGSRRVSGVVLLAVMPLDWYDVEITAHRGLKGAPDHISGLGLGRLTAVDVLIALSALVAIALLVLVASAGSPSPGDRRGRRWGSCSPRSSVLWCCFTCSTCRAPWRAWGLELETTRTAAGYLGTAAAVAIPVALLFAMRDERRSTPDRLTDVHGRPRGRRAASRTAAGPAGVTFSRLLRSDAVAMVAALVLPAGHGHGLVLVHRRRARAGDREAVRAQRRLVADDTQRENQESAREAARPRRRTPGRPPG